MRQPIRTPPDGPRRVLVVGVKWEWERSSWQDCSVLYYPEFIVMGVVMSFVKNEQKTSDSILAVNFFTAYIVFV